MKPSVERLVNEWIEGSLDAEGEARLRELLAEDPEAREACYELMLLDQLLEERETSAGEQVLPPRREAPRRGWHRAAVLVTALTSAAALLFAALWFAGRPGPGSGAVVAQDPPVPAGPPITASSDSRITIAQREDRGRWSPGELLRLERGTAAIRLGEGALALLEGPAAVKLVNAEGDIHLLEGRACFQVEAGGRALRVEMPGGTLTAAGTDFVCQIAPDRAAVVEVNEGALEILSRAGTVPARIGKGEAARVEANGTVLPTARPGMPFRANLPEELALFLDRFDVPDETPLAGHAPAIGGSWKVLSEANPTLITEGKLDTSGGARQLATALEPHDPGGTGSVYVFTFSLVPPSWSHDKVHRLDGLESITVTDQQGAEIFSLSAEAVNTHRWRLSSAGEVSPLTPVCALWDHRLTVCYGLDGRVTLHDGGTAQSPVIASLWVPMPEAAGGLLVKNRTGGDLAFRQIGVSLLRAPASPRSE